MGRTTRLSGERWGLGGGGGMVASTPTQAHKRRQFAGHFASQLLCCLVAVYTYHKIGWNSAKKNRTAW